MSFFRIQSIRLRKIQQSIAFGLALLTVALAHGQDASESQQELESVGAAIEDIREWLSKASETQSLEEVALKKAETDVAALSGQMSETRLGISQVQTELNVLTAETQTLNSQKTQQVEILNGLIRSAYIRGEPNLLKSFFSQDDISNSARMLHYTLKFSEAQLEKIASFESLIEKIKTTEAAAVSKIAELNQQNAALELQLAGLDNARLQKRSALTSLRDSIASKGKELEQLELNQAQLQQLVEEIRTAMEGVRSFADVPSFSDAKGQLATPLAGRFSNRFGERYGDGNLIRQGITIQAELGTPVRAVHAGHVVFADWLRGSGLLVIIDHGDGFMSLYGGNEALSAKAGSWIDAGDILSTSGTSISSGESGLYFEIRRHGQPQDPDPWFSSR